MRLLLIPCLHHHLPVIHASNLWWHHTEIPPDSGESDLHLLKETIRGENVKVIFFI